MKRLIIIAVLALAAISFAAEGFSVGARVGLSYDDWWGYDNDYFSLPSDFWGLGFNGSVGVLYSFTPLVALHSELGVSFRSSSAEMEPEDEEEALEEAPEMSFNQWNLDIPVLLRVTPGNFFLEAGPMISFNLDSYIKFEQYGMSADLDMDYNTFEFSLAFGAGVSIPVAGHKLDVDFRYVLGMTNLFEMKGFVKSFASLDGGEISDGALEQFLEFYGLDKLDMPKTWQFQLALTYWFM